MKISENILFAVAKRMYTRNMGQSEEMAEALADDASYANYRQECIHDVLKAADEHGVPYKGKTVLDLGCYDGAISGGYLTAGAEHVIGVDIDEPAVRVAQKEHSGPNIEFHVSNTVELPLPDNSIDSIFCYDVFEHVACPSPILEQCNRVLKPGGKMLIGTWGWYHPFAPHLWSMMPVPWAHVLFSEKTMLRVCRRIYNSDFYVPNMHDFDADGIRKPDKYQYESISTDYLNKYLIRDFEKVFRSSPLNYKINQQRFSSKWAAWTQPLLKVPFLKEFFTAYIWVVLEKPAVPAMQNVRQGNPQQKSQSETPVLSASAP